MSLSRTNIAHSLLLAGLILAAVWAMPAPARAQEKQPAEKPLSAEQVKDEIERLRAEIEKYRNSPRAPAAWKDLLAAEARLDAAKQARRKEVDELRVRITKLASAPDCLRWAEPIEKMDSRLRELEIEDWKLTKDDGFRLIQARHKELSKVAAVETPRLRSLGLDILNYPRMDGSTSCQPLAALIACRCFDARYEWVGHAQRRFRNRSDDDDLDLGGWFGQPEPELELLEFTLQAKTDSPAEHRLGLIINRLLAHNASTHNAYINLIEGKSEIGLLARAPSPDELALARMKNIELEALPCALDAFVFLVNRDNSVRNLTATQIRDIYAGNIKNWSEFGGAKGAITPYQREENSGSQQLMRDLVMKDVAFETLKGKYASPPRFVERLMSSVYLALTSDKGGLAYSVYYYERFMSGSPRTRTIAVDGIEATEDAIRQRKYPLTTEVFVVTRKGLAPTDPAARLRDWLLSPEGQSVVRESGYVPLPVGK
ncbi:MAG TPA: substrate-binding domain-containing protein [Planctomycetaceae bacterium]|jgi:phosphate transport system substrate-binding protein